jgi:hypothetical protein
MFLDILTLIWNFPKHGHSDLKREKTGKSGAEDAIIAIG